MRCLVAPLCYSSLYHLCTLRSNSVTNMTATEFDLRLVALRRKLVEKRCITLFLTFTSCPSNVNAFVYFVVFYYAPDFLP